ncbi:hypothetical protein [Saccharopolyspora sp. NPDC049357]|uniref:hypothetical protein n=1 Tax=Saccharopolyspora sp. NPDC049357 TaxID=3154507 RepID=UPI00342418B6
MTLRRFGSGAVMVAEGRALPVGSVVFDQARQLRFRASASPRALPPPWRVSPRWADPILERHGRQGRLLMGLFVASGPASSRVLAIPGRM